MTRTLMFVHAHPDDEASKGAATAARYVDEGARVVLVTCTDGGAGEVLNPHYGEDIPPGRMAEVRRAELERAAKIIGFSATYLLGFPDSGLVDDPPPGSFAALPLEEVAGALAEVIRRERPAVVVTYPPDGGYPHPDHIRVHEATMAAIELAAGDGRPGREVAKVYAAEPFPTERLRALEEAAARRGLDGPFRDWLARRRDRPERPITARIWVADWFDRRDAALRAHATQVDPEGWWFAIPRDLEREAYPWEAYSLLRSTVPVDPPEDDLFAGVTG